ncbi:MAG: isochorismatase family protein [Alphaproteobacteria bacterium]|nr:isochorismatase family protein [Alphaproteobacteria bacterium]
MTTANIVFLIDIQNGFIRNNLTPEQGGCLGVPNGKKVCKPAGKLIRNLKNAFVILSQDFHPKNHVSFKSNHPNGLWPDHCVQGTESAAFVKSVMNELPFNMIKLLYIDSTLPVLMEKDERKNTFFVIRKGMNPNLDSYGIATENDGVSTTRAPRVFKDIAGTLKGRGIEKAQIHIGGLATNFCVEFSHNDIYKLLIPALNKNDIKANVNLLTDISAGIPDAFVQSGFEVSSAMKRMSEKGTTFTTTEDLFRNTVPRRGKMPQQSYMPG